jgi:cardiolipin synthase
LFQQIEIHGLEATTHTWEEQVKPWVTWADLLTALRVPLAIAFPFVRHPAGQLALVGAAAASDFFDGMLARHLGSSRTGALLDPVADKLFMAAAFLTVAARGLLHPVAMVAVLARDLVAMLGALGAWLWRRPMTLPARAGGKAVTVLQLLTLVAVITGSPYARRLTWATAAVGLYAIWDYARVASRRGAPHGAEGT